VKAGIGRRIELERGTIEHHAMQDDGDDVAGVPDPMRRISLDQEKLLAKRHRTQLTVHRRDGTIVQTQSYSAAPIG